MTPRRRGFLSMLDDTVRWTGMPARITAQISGDPDGNHRPLRWIPIWPIVFSCFLLVIFLVWPPLLDGMNPGALIGVIVAFWGGAFAMLPHIYMNGPLGKSSLDDDERVAALRKDSLLFCVGLLAILNVFAQPLLMMLSHWQDWKFAKTASVAATAFMLNATLWGCLPTLYASWKVRQLPKE